MQTRKPLIPLTVSTTLALLLVPVAALSGQKPKEWSPDIDPSSFVSVVDNVYFPLTPGRTFRYEDRASGETLVIEVTHRTKTVMGVRTIVVIETVAENGRTVEISENWFAQDRDGNVWYFGEFSRDFENGVPVNSAGSWEAGINGAVPGIIMLAQPAPGDTYFQENAPGVAEDMAAVQSVGLTEVTPMGAQSNVLKTKEWTPLEPGKTEHKYYAPGIGLIAEEQGGHRLELVAIE